MSMTWIEVVGIVAFLTNVWANLLIARKSERGWTIRLVSNAWWLAFGIAAGSIANVLNAVTFAGINVYGLVRWRRERLALIAKQLAVADDVSIFGAYRVADPPRLPLGKPVVGCVDHHRVCCAFCGDITRQCRCHSAAKKTTTRDGICGTCRAQLVDGKPQAMTISEVA